ncbi:MAG: hypothetical protein K9K62_05995 [Desulfobacteraceae bacterium]|nr:hypothetical protein [Desulfobacteraceae bacterium]
MKKSIIIINTILCLVFLAPLGALAMEPISKAEMDSVTGQKGVSIAAGNTTFYQEVDFWYRDPDGTSGDNGAAVGFYGLQFMNYGHAITWEIGADDPTEFNAEPPPPFFHFVEEYDYKNRGLEASDLTGTLENIIGDWTVRDFEARAIFIDFFSTLPADTPNIDPPVIFINVPTIAMHLTHRQMNLAITGVDNPLHATASEMHSLGTFEAGPTTMFFMDGDLMISPGGDPSL